MVQNDTYNPDGKKKNQQYIVKKKLKIVETSD